MPWGGGLCLFWAYGASGYWEFLCGLSMFVLQGALPVDLWVVGGLI